MEHLVTMPNLPNPRDFDKLLIDLHNECEEAERRKRSAKLMLTLANHIGDETVE